MPCINCKQPAVPSLICRICDIRFCHAYVKRFERKCPMCHNPLETVE